MTKIVLFGKGYVGTGLSSYLQKNSLNVKGFSKTDLDYTNPIILKQFLSEYKPTVIINSSGYTGVPNVDACESNKNLCWFWNVQVPHTIALACDVLNIPLIQVSSGCIYSGYDKEYTECDIPNFGFYNNQSSYYSQCKHISEMVLSNFRAHILRIRMPFDSTLLPKNYLNKIFKYNNLISQKNSLTSMTDFYHFVYNLLPIAKGINPGPINVVNPGGLEAKEIVSILRQHGVENKNWNFVEMKNLDIVAGRSNCVLSTDYTKKLGIELPNSITSLERDIQQFAKHFCP